MTPSNTPPSKGCGKKSSKDLPLDEKLKLLEKADQGKSHTFAPRSFVLATFPHRPTDETDLELVNGNMTMTLHSRKGLPGGVYPRLIMLWLTEECQARKRQGWDPDVARRIELGTGINQFMARVGVPATGGANGTITRLKEQLRRLLATTISIDWAAEGEGGRRGELSIDALVSEERMLWWDGSDAAIDDQDALLPSYVVLSRKFYDQLVDSPVPVSVPIIRALRRSPMALDLYSWLTHRYSYLSKPSHVTWEQLRGQLGAGYPTDARGKRNFKSKVKKSLDMVKTYYPEARFKVGDSGLTLMPSPTSVAQKKAYRAIQDPIPDEK